MRPLIAAHRGASGYLPESTLPAKAMAHAMGADYAEHDVVMTKDDHVLVNHDLWLDEVSDVARRFPGRQRPDDHFYVIDFTLEEILSLSVTDRFRVRDGVEVPAWPDRFPLWQSDFRFHTLESELQLLQGLKKSTGRAMGIFTELKSPWFHEQEGKDLCRATLEILHRYGYRSRDDLCRVMSFDPHALRRIHDEVGPAIGVDVPLTQLITRTSDRETFERDPDGTWTNYDSDWMLTPEGMPRIAEYADGIGPDYRMLIDPASERGAVTPNDLTRAAHDAGLYVTPWTVRRDELPSWAASTEDVLEVLAGPVGVDGIITDFPDIAVDYFAGRVPVRAGADASRDTAAPGEPDSLLVTA